MNGVRVEVEHAFGIMCQRFAFLNYEQGLHARGSPIAKYIAAGAVLSNAHACLYPNQTSRRFGVAPPHLEVYLRAAGESVAVGVQRAQQAEQEYQ